MPRNASGTYTLPAGNPVVSGTPISSTVHNGTNNDIATALTDSLSRSGLGGMLAPLPFLDGSNGNPSITFTLELTTGIYRAGAGDMSVSVLGTQTVSFQQDGLYGRFPFYEWNVGLSQFVPLLNGADDYTIEGEWDFTKPVILGYDTVNFVGSSVAGGGAVTAHADTLQNSGLIRIVTVAPGVAEGKPGDIWLVVA